MTMRIVTWCMVGLLTIAVFQYSLFKENGEPRRIPTLQQVLR
ncbi:hypothetical protein [Pseudomonas sp. SDO55104_S430]